MDAEDSQPLVSVVIPSYNRATMLGEALQSVEAQTYRPLEVVVVDDGSTDDTAEVVSTWAGEHETDGFLVRYVRQDNLGGNAARNRGISEAKGGFVAFLDSDDRWDRGKLERQMAEFEDDAGIGGVYCGVRHVDAATGRVTEPAGRAYPRGRLLDQILVRDITAPTSAWVLRREVFHRVGEFDTGLEARQDWDMWIRVAAEFEIGCVPAALVEYREHAGPRTASDPSRELRAYGRIMEKYADLRVRQRWPVRRAAMAAYWKRRGRVHFHHRISTSKAIRYYLRSLAAWPFDFDSWAALGGVLLPRGLRAAVHRGWNRIFGRTRLAIRSH